MENIKKILKSQKGKTLMVVYPHPDDETFGAGGLIQVTKSLGWKTIIVCLTKGGAGKIFVHGKGRSAIEIREGELKKVAKILGASELLVSNFPDAYLTKDKKEWSDYLTKLITRYDPSILVTYDHSGLSANPDHIIVSVELLKMVKKLKQKPILFWNTVNFNDKRFFEAATDKRIKDLVSKPTHILKLNFGQRLSKFRALLKYKSQFPLKMILMISLFVFKNKFEWYHKVDLSKHYKHRFVEFKL